MGANLFNMAVIGSFVGYFVYRLVQWPARGRRWGIFAGGALAAWVSIEVSALSAALQLSVSGTSPANIAFPAMGGIHALIGIGEALITVGALSFVYAARRDLLKLGAQQSSGSRVVWAGGLAITLVLAVLSPLASRHPDGLIWVAQQAGFAQKASGPHYNILKGYAFPGISNATTATIIAAVIGALIVMGVAGLVAYTRRIRPVESDTKTPGD
jgi:cobalt/nickel transport system permease protein